MKNNKINKLIESYLKEDLNDYKYFLHKNIDDTRKILKKIKKNSEDDLAIELLKSKRILKLKFLDFSITERKKEDESYNVIFIRTKIYFEGKNTIVVFEYDESNKLVNDRSGRCFVDKASNKLLIKNF